MAKEETLCIRGSLSFSQPFFIGMELHAEAVTGYLYLWVRIHCSKSFVGGSSSGLGRDAFHDLPRILHTEIRESGSNHL